MSVKTTKIPDSDTSARHPRSEEEERFEDAGNLDGRQTSIKSGKHSSVTKEAASRPGYGKGAGAKPVPGATGKQDTSNQGIPKSRTKGRKGGSATP